ncbi:MAG: HEAT repeat domain-containing protein, partial [Bryobacteraceae bacterium]
DEDLKLYALSSLSRTEPERVIPLVARILDSASSLRLKERALYVLAQTRSAQALPTVTKLAKGGGTPDLQRKAVEYLGVFESPEVGQTLSEIYTSTSDQDIKRAVLHSYVRAKDKTRLLAAARSESNEDLKREAIQALAASGATDEVWSLYQDSIPEGRVNALRAIGTRAGAEKLTEIARSDKDPRLRALAVQYLGRMRTTQTLEALLGFYGSEADVTVRKAIISGVYSHGEAKPLVELARKESNAELKKAIVERLSHMRSKEASDYMVELLNK